MAKRSKRKKKPVWKKLGQEIDHVSAHLGKMFDNSRIDEITEAGINLYLAQKGYKFFKSIDGAFFGPIMFQLAKAESTIAAGVGIGGLAFIGIGIPALDIFGDYAETRMPPELSGVDPAKVEEIGTPTRWEMHQMITGIGQIAEDLRAKYWEN